MTLGRVFTQGWVLRAICAFVLGFVGAVALNGATADAASIQPTKDAKRIADSLAVDPELVQDASFLTIPGDPADHAHSTSAVSDRPLAGFATHGPDYGILTTGNPTIAWQDNHSEDSTEQAGGGHFQGSRNFDVTVLAVEIDVPEDAGNCLSMNYRFLSEEFDEFVGSDYNDTFIVQLDRHDWLADGNKVTAPGDFATAGEPIGVNSAGPYAVSAALAKGTTYDAATNLINAETPVTSGPHTVYVSIFDQEDDRYDSAAFIDKLQVTEQAPGDCAPPPVTTPTVAQLAKPRLGPDSNIAKFDSVIKAKNLKGFSGTASADDKVAGVQIALVQVKYGAQASVAARKRSKKRKRGARCIHMNARRLMTQRRAVAKRCSPTIWIAAAGTEKWSFDLRRKLPKGNYVLYSRAIDSDGVAESRYDAADNNRVTFRVR